MCTDLTFIQMFGNHTALISKRLIRPIKDRIFLYERSLLNVLSVPLLDRSNSSWSSHSHLVSFCILQVTWSEESCCVYLLVVVPDGCDVCWCVFRVGNMLFSVETQTTEDRTQQYQTEIEALYKDLTAKGKALMLSSELGVRPRVATSSCNFHFSYQEYIELSQFHFTQFKKHQFKDIVKATKQHFPVNSFSPSCR